jgi:hypothetical protein
MKYSIAIFSLLFLFSCSGNKTTKSEKAVDSSSSVSELMKSPLVINDKSLKDSFPLSASFIAKNVLPLSDTFEGTWELQTFLKIDSLKNAKKYEDYVKGLDIGQMQESKAWVYDTIPYSKGKAILWGVNYESYPACPSASGRVFFLTLFSDAGTAVQTKKILDISSGADAPVWGYTNGECTINPDFSISCLDSIVNGGEQPEEANYEEIITSTLSRKYVFGANGQIKLTESKKSPEVKSKKYYENQ